MTYRVSRVKLPAVRQAIADNLWAILPEKLEAILEVVEAHAFADGFTAEEIEARLGPGRRRQAATTQIRGNIAVLPIYGTIAQRMSVMAEMSGGTSTEQLGATFDQLVRDPEVGAIVLDIDSPGGTVSGVLELARKIHAARGEKPIIAVANSMMASAAYWIGTAADEVVATPSGEVGSIGVFTVHTDLTEAAAKEGIRHTFFTAGKYKAERTPFRPLTEEARAAIQAQIDEVYGQFVAAVARHRGTTPAAVRAGYGEGRTLLARPALEAGMIDRIATLEEVISDLAGGGRAARRSSGAAAAEGAEPTEPTAASGTVTLYDVAAADGAAASEPTETADAGEAASAPQPAAPLVTTPAPAAKETPVEHQTTAANNGAAPTAAAAPAVDRGAQITELCVLANVPAEQALAYIRGPMSVDEVRADLLKQQASRSAQPHVVVGRNREADRPWASLGEQLAAIAAASTPGGKLDARLAAASGGSAGSGPDGGYMIHTDFATDLLSSAFETGELASRCSTTPIGENADGLEVVYLDETSRANGSRWGGVQVYRVAEADTVEARRPELGTWECRLSDMMGIAYMTNRQLQDAPAMESVYQEAFTSELAFKLDDEIFGGTGVGQCLGFMKSGALVTVAKESGQAAATVVANNIIKMWARMPQRWRRDAVWLINQEVEPQLQTMYIATGDGGQLIYMPAGGISGSQYGTIYGRPVVPIEHASALGTAGDISLVSLSQYKLIAKGGIQAEQSIHVRFLYNERAFRWVTRVSGAPKLKSAITPYKGASTLSPFITLATRA